MIISETNKVNHAFNMSQGEQYSLVYDPQARLNFMGTWLCLLRFKIASLEPYYYK